MKKIFESPEVKVINLGANDILTTSGVSRGQDIGSGENVSCDAPGRIFYYDWDDEY